MMEVLASIIGGTFFVLFMAASCMYIYAGLVEGGYDE